MLDESEFSVFVMWAGEKVTECLGRRLPLNEGNLTHAGYDGSPLWCVLWCISKVSLIRNA